MLMVVQRWIFWINLPFCGLAFIMIPLFLKLHYRTESLVSKLKKVDWLGSVVFVASMTSILVPLTWGGVMYPWDHVKTIVPLVIGLVGIWFFIYSSIRFPTNALIRVNIFKPKTAWVTYIGTVLHGTIVGLSFSFSFKLNRTNPPNSSGPCSTISLFTTRSPNL